MYGNLLGSGYLKAVARKFPREGPNHEMSTVAERGHESRKCHAYRNQFVRDLPSYKLFYRDSVVIFIIN